MAKFEVFIPAQDSVGFDMTFRVDADNWMAALKTGMQKVGQAGPGGNILCDIKEDNSIHVTDPGSGSVFRIREIEEMEPEAMAVSAAISPAPAAPLAYEAQDDQTDPGLPANKSEDQGRETGGRTEPAMPAAKAAPPPPPAAPVVKAAPPPPPAAPPHFDTDVRKVEEIAAPSVTPNQRIGRSVTKRTQAEIEEILTDLFERSQEIAASKSVEAAMTLVLKLAMEKVPSESGSVYRADISARTLSFSAALGPKAADLLKMGIKLPVGVGLAGVAVQEGVGIAISDVDRDPRFFKAISDRLGYATKSVVTVPVQQQGQVMGAIQLINRKQGSTFSEDDLSILAYLAHQAAAYLQASGAVTL